jgi:hypothetical protein
MAVGGLAVRPERADAITADLLKINQECGLRDGSEVKWAKCKKRHKSVHAEYLRYLFGAIESGFAHLHIRISPFTRYDHAASGARKETDTVSKAFFQLLLHRAARYYGGQCRLLVRADAGDCTAYLPNMLDGLNTLACENFGFGAQPFVDIASRDSKSEPLLQLLDVALGALTAARNGTHIDGTLEQRKKS